MKAHITSYAGLFSLEWDAGLKVDTIEIPLIQRDYAQGRPGADVARIRSNFVKALHHAVTTGAPLHLDFVYGDVKDGVLRPLDGQQRLTTLFLLHWYLAYRADQLDTLNEWKRFSYATRPTARLFCKRLVKYRPPNNLRQSLSDWLKDQPQHLHTWNQDPTISGMLVMLDSIHEHFRNDDDTECTLAWKCLVDGDAPAIQFHLLPTSESGSGEERYIKMNSRGRPLTSFENFKARFEKTVEASCPGRSKELANKFDGKWSNLLWSARGENNAIDEEYMRLLRLFLEVIAWRSDSRPESNIDELADRLLGKGNDRAGENLDWLIGGFDAWPIRGGIEEYYSAVFARQHTPERVVLFNLPENASVNLFALCCRSYGETRGRNRIFTLQLTLLFYATLLERREKASDFARRIRVLRNLVEASDDEIRFERMPKLIANTERVITTGKLDDIGAFNTAQVGEEQRKARLLAQHPKLAATLCALEDHRLLRGNLTAFELGPDGVAPSQFESRARTFHRVFEREHWQALSAALLTQGNYARRRYRDRHHFGSWTAHGPWEDVLQGANRTAHEHTRNALMALLDRLADVDDIADSLTQLRSDWLEAADKERHYDWRYYLIKYDVMRSGKSGIFASETGMMGYRLCLLDKRQLNSNYRDAFLFAVARQPKAADETASSQEPKLEEHLESLKFTGFARTPRWMLLKQSGIGLRNIDVGFQLRPPADAAHQAAYRKICVTFGIGEDHLLRVPQTEHDRKQLDQQDRVKACAKLIRAFVKSGL